VERVDRVGAGLRARQRDDDTCDCRFVAGSRVGSRAMVRDDAMRGCAPASRRDTAMRRDVGGHGAPALTRPGRAWGPPPLRGLLVSACGLGGAFLVA